MHLILFRWMALCIVAFFLFFLCGCGGNSGYIAVSGNAGLGEPSACDVLIARDGYTLGYNYEKRQALWVSYILEKVNLEVPQVKRTDDFRTDPSVRIDPVDPREYIRSGFDRGHLAPAADMAYSGKVMSESFFMSNMSPQLPGCNRRSWLAVEQILRVWAKREGRLYVVTGAVFTPFKGKIPANFRIAVPGHFYKVVLDLTPPYKMIGFIVPNENVKFHSAEDFAVSVDEVEKITGYDFFDLLDDELEDELEAQNNFDQWGK